MSDNEKTTQPASTDSTEPAYRYNAALAQDIEGKWQKIWDDKGTFWAANVNGDLKDGKGRNADGRPAYFAMDMFPYPSGKGLHVGHPLGYLASDVVSRYHRMKGENVLHAMGYDAFGLPAEQYAVQTGQHPRVTTLANIANMSRQLHRMGLSFDDRIVATGLSETMYVFVSAEVWHGISTKDSSVFSVTAGTEEFPFISSYACFRNRRCQ